MTTKFSKEEQATIRKFLVDTFLPMITDATSALSGSVDAGFVVVAIVEDEEKVGGTCISILSEAQEEVLERARKAETKTEALEAFSQATVSAAAANKLAASMNDEMKGVVDRADELIGVCKMF